MTATASARACRAPARRCLGIVLALLVAAGCALPSPFGLSPKDPPLRRDWARGGLAFFPVTSRQPTLCWEEFPSEPDRLLDPEVLGEVADVAYDLRVGVYDGTGAPAVLYARNGLAETCHRLEDALRPGTRYLWTVRARFAVHGEPRVTEWGVTDSAFRRSVSPLAPCSYRFQTPPGGD